MESEPQDTDEVGTSTIRQSDECADTMRTEMRRKGRQCSGWRGRWGADYVRTLIAVSSKSLHDAGIYSPTSNDW